MSAMQRITIGVALAGIVALGSIGSPITPVNFQIHKAVHAHDEVDCTYAENRNCGWFFCSCEGATTSLCEGESDCPTKKEQK